jgi:hypothetical protein
MKPRENRRLFLDEFPEEIQNKIVNFFERNKILVISDLIKGRVVYLLMDVSYYEKC